MMGSLFEHMMGSLFEQERNIRFAGCAEPINERNAGRPCSPRWPRRNRPRVGAILWIAGALVAAVIAILSEIFANNAVFDFL
jgi:hypothetical protein